MPRISPEGHPQQPEYQELQPNGFKRGQRNNLVNFILSFRLFLVILIMALVVSTALSIWLAAYFMNEQAAVQSTQILLETIKGKVSNFLDGPLLMAKSSALAMADDYHRSVIQTDHSICPYFHNRIVNNNVTLMTIGIGEGLNLLYAVDPKSFAKDNELYSKPSFANMGGDQETKSGLSSSYMNTDHAKKKVDLFKIGLNSIPSSIMYIKLGGIHEKSFENYQEMSNLISKCYINILQICKSMKVDVHTKSFDEYTVIQNDNLSTIETSLKIKSFFSSLNETQKNEGKLQVQLQIGISSNTCLQGNIGNKQMRYFAMVGSAMKCSRDLAFFNSVASTKILVDEKTYLRNKAHVNYVFIPVDRYSGVNNGNSDCIQIIYELVKKSHVDDDEWLYELENKKANERLNTLCEKFPLLFTSNVSDQDVKEVLSSIEELQSVQTFYSKLWEHLKGIAKRRLFDSEDLSNYHTNIGITTETLLSPNSTDPERMIEL